MMNMLRDETGYNDYNMTMKKMMDMRKWRNISLMKMMK